MSVVAKFGGTSVADFTSMCRCADIIINNPNIRLVVVSASSGVTNDLVALTNTQITDEKRTTLIEHITEIELEILQSLGAPSTISNPLHQLLKNIASLSHELSIQPSKAKSDELLSIGEQCSSLLLAEVLRQKGCLAESFDVRNVMRTDSQFGKAHPDIEQISKRATTQLLPLISDKVIITQGFIGADEQGHTTTLGRGGSDYSAALLAEAIAADSLEIWTDVPGIFTTDPRFTDKAHPLTEISFNEAAEMATFGAKVLHPSTILPAVRKKIKVFVGSSREPERGGSWIKHQIANAPVYRAIAIRREQTLLNLHSLNMLHAQGFLAQIFSTLAKHKISVDLITTSEVNVSLTLDKTGSDSSGHHLLTDELIAELSEHCEVNVDEHLALVAIIGNNIASTAGVCKQVFSVLSDYNIRMICQGASPHNLCLLVEDEQAADIVQILHKHLFED